MKTKKIPIGQFINETQNSDGATYSFLKKTAPLIGYIVHSFNSLEELLNSTICDFINERSDEPGLIVIHNLNFSAKVDLFERYLKSIQFGMNVELPTFKILIEKLRESGKLRNAVIHADWETTDFDGYTFMKHKMGSNPITYRQFNLMTK